MKEEMNNLIKNETKLFQWIDPDFENWNVDEGIKAKKQKLATKIPDKDFTFKDVFKEEDAISQEEVIDYVKEHKKEIEKFSHLFLLKNSKGEFFVASVLVLSVGELGVCVYRLEYSSVWFAGGRRRVVVPQLALEPFDLSQIKITIEGKNYGLVEEEI